MSLINDALKRAKDSQPATTPAPEPVQPMTPVEPPPEPARSAGLPPYFLPAALIVLSGACWFLIKGWETKRQAGIYPEPIMVHAREIETANPPEPAKPATAPTEFAATDVARPAPAPAAAPAVTPPVSEPTPVPPASEPAPRPQPAFKLQGIFYRTSNPSAVINAKTVFVGDTIEEAKVKSIDRQSVTLVQEGQTKVLTLH